MQTLIHNATLVLPDRVVEHGWLLIEGERILDLGEATTCPSSASRSIDASTRMLLPGIIDLHCDSIERLVMPRPNIYFPLALALEEADWRLAGSGITTEFHAVSLDDGEFGVRSDNFVRELSRAICDEQRESMIRHKIHARLELTSQRGSEAIVDMITMREVGLVSLMDHSPGQGQYRTEQAFREYVAKTASKTHTEIDALIALKRVQAAHVLGRIERVTHLAREAELGIATHDDDNAEKVAQWPHFGVTVSEFPTTMEAAQKAHELGLAVCMGAPNVLRGMSSGGNLSATEAIQAGVADVLCSDYYPSAMLGAAYKLFKEDVLTLPQAVRLITLNPAHAVRIGHDFGSLERGKVADIILVNVSKQGLPYAQRVFVDGREKVVRG
ncbi:MAG: alpha-D-ribose 1-methylphosphonate 5-triphosphate diphosphatase [Ktedonobacteraceae bacterium]